MDDDEVKRNKFTYDVALALIEPGKKIVFEIGEGDPDYNLSTVTVSIVDSQNQEVASISDTFARRWSVSDITNMMCRYLGGVPGDITPGLHIEVSQSADYTGTVLYTPASM